MIFLVFTLLSFRFVCDGLPHRFVTPRKKFLFLSLFKTRITLYFLGAPAVLPDFHPTSLGYSGFPGKICEPQAGLFAIYPPTTAGDAASIPRANQVFVEFPKWSHYREVDRSNPIPPIRTAKVCRCPSRVLTVFLLTSASSSSAAFRLAFSVMVAGSGTDSTARISRVLSATHWGMLMYSCA